MADNQPIISPFVGQSDREYFAAWLSGFVDGEGCFQLVRNVQKQRIFRDALFTIRLRRDDRPVLEAIQSFWGEGKIYDGKSYGNSRPQSALTILKQEALEGVIIPHFDRYPLIAKKRQDFEVWKRGVAIMGRVARRPRRSRGCNAGIFPQWIEEDASEFDGLVALLAETRRYSETDYSAVLKRIPMFSRTTLTP